MGNGIGKWLNAYSLLPDSPNSRTFLRLTVLNQMYLTKFRRGNVDPPAIPVIPSVRTVLALMPSLAVSISAGAAAFVGHVRCAK